MLLAVAFSEEAGRGHGMSSQELLLFSNEIRLTDDLTFIEVRF